MRMRWLTAVAAVTLIGLIKSVAAQEGRGLANSAHDLTGRRVDAVSQICKFCHVPPAGGDAGPAEWTGQHATTGDFGAFGDPVDLDPVSPRPMGTSLVCLSCHDGTVAWNILAIPGVTASIRRMGGAIQRGANNFANAHPASVSYFRSYDATFNTPVAGQVGDLPLFRAVGTMGWGDRVECASCHNPHEIAFGKFLRVSNVDSGLCRNCHDM